MPYKTKDGVEKQPVYIVSGDTNLLDMAGAQINPSTEDTLALIKDTDGIKKITDALPTGTNSIGNTGETKPTTVIQGTTTGITTTAAQMIVASTPIKKVVVAKITSMGTGTYIAFGNATAQPFKLTAAGDALDIDWTSDLNKVYLVTDAGNTGSVEWVGG